MPLLTSAASGHPHTRTSLGAVVCVVAALVGVAGCSSSTEGSTHAPPRIAAFGVVEPSPRGSSGQLRSDVSAYPPGELRRVASGPPGAADAVGVSDGHLPDGVEVFDSYPGLKNLDPALLAALRRAATEAAGDAITIHVNSGWRSAAYQAQLFREAVGTYGSRAGSARWVATPATSPHVAGEAVDVGELDAVTWLSEHGATFGLCQVYDNEPWHFELRPRAVDLGCPDRYADPSQDPRMQQ